MLSKYISMLNKIIIRESLLKETKKMVYSQTYLDSLKDRNFYFSETDDIHNINDAYYWYKTSKYNNLNWFQGFDEDDFVRFVYLYSYEYKNFARMVAAYIEKHGYNPTDYGITQADLDEIKPSQEFRHQLN